MKHKYFVEADRLAPSPLKGTVTQFGQMQIVETVSADFLEMSFGFFPQEVYWKKQSLFLLSINN